MNSKFDKISIQLKETKDDNLHIKNVINQLQASLSNTDNEKVRYIFDNTSNDNTLSRKRSSDDSTIKYTTPNIKQRRVCIRNHVRLIVLV